jgi:hypothetical protein
VSNRVTLEQSTDSGARTVHWNPRQAGSGERGVEVYRSRGTTLAPGEAIRWTRNSPERHLVNGQRLQVTAVAPGRIEAQTESGQSVSIDTATPAGQHWEHGLVSTIYAAQGRTAAHVLVNAPSDQPGLFDRPAFLVGISRQRESLKVYTDDRARLAHNLEQHSGEKTRALDTPPAADRAEPAVAPPSPESRLQALVDVIAQQCQEVVKRLQNRGRERPRDFDPSSSTGRHRDRDMER